MNWGWECTCVVGVGWERGSCEGFVLRSVVQDREDCEIHSPIKFVMRPIQGRVLYSGPCLRDVLLSSV